MATKPRDYRREYELYQGTPEQRKARSERNKARRAYEKAHGNLPSTVDVDHVKPMSKGGGNGLSNLRAAPKSQNRSFARNANNSMKSQRSKREAKK